MSTNSIPTGEVMVNETPRNENLPEGLPQETSYCNWSEKCLSTIATAILIVGILASFILLSMGINYLSSYSKESLGSAIIEKAVCLFLSSFILWGTLKVLCNISNNLHEINTKMKK